MWLSSHPWVYRSIVFEKAENLKRIVIAVLVQQPLERGLENR